MCRECLNDLADMLDAIATRAMDWQIKASWHGWPVDEEGPYAGYQPWLPTVPTFGWHAWFQYQDAGRREMIRAKVEVLLAAQELIKHT